MTRSDEGIYVDKGIYRHATPSPGRTGFARLLESALGRWLLATEGFALAVLKRSD